MADAIWARNFLPAPQMGFQATLNHQSTDRLELPGTDELHLEATLVSERGNFCSSLTIVEVAGQIPAVESVHGTG